MSTINQTAATDKTLLENDAGIAACTIISKNYLPYARVLFDSLSKNNPELDFFVLLVDRADGYFNAGREPFHVVEISQLDIPDLDRFCFKYTLLELNTAAKPFFLDYLLREFKLRKLIYFDPDILILNDLTTLLGLLDQHSIVLTPHLTTPLEEDGYRPVENDILLAGAYNLGFIALASSQTTKDFLSWWQARTYNNCLVDFEKGLFVDQKWIDLVPGAFEGVHILRDPGYNIAYWNLNNRPIEFRNDRAYVNTQPCYFFHFSGFNPENIKPISKYQNRLTIENVGQSRVLFKRYSDLLIKHGYLITKNWPYAFSHFDNGVKITDLIRRIYLDLGGEAERFGNPFVTEEAGSYFNWLCESADREKDPEKLITNIWYEIYKRRKDLQQAFPDVFGKHRPLLIRWMNKFAASEYSLDYRFCINTAGKDRKYKVPVAPRRLYQRLTQPLEPTIKTLIRKSLGRNEAVWRKILMTHRRLKGTLKNSPPVEIDNGQTTASTAGNNYAGEVQKPFGINLAGYVASEKGVGEALRSQVRCFQEMDIPYVLNDFRDVGSANIDNRYKFISADNPFAINLIQVNADQVPAFAKARGQAYFENHYNIGYWNWELSGFPPEWQSSFRYFDEIWVASSFVLDSISRVSPIPVVRVPLCLGEDNAGANWDRSAFKLPEQQFVFLFAFDFHSILARKNPLGLIEAFKKAFNKNEDVMLVLKCSHSLPDQIKSLRLAAGGANITIIDKVMSRDEVNALMKASDCYVSLHRSEGFGLTMAEAMWAGKPVIATAYSGNMDFMNIANSFLVKYRLVEIESDFGPYKKGYVWAEPDLDHAAELMQFVFFNRESAKMIGQRGQSDVIQLLHPKAAGAIVKERLLKAAPSIAISD